MGRLRDAYQALLGRTSTQVEIARMRTEWADLMLDVANLMDKLASMVGRFSKREVRKATKNLTPQPDARAAKSGFAPTRWERKAELRRRRMGQALPLEIPEPEPEREEAEA